MKNTNNTAIVIPKSKGALIIERKLTPDALIAFISLSSDSLPKVMRVAINTAIGTERAIIQAKLRKMNSIIKKVFKRKYKIQKIDGLEEKKVTPPEEVYERIKRENKWIGEARAINSDLDFFKNKFINPLENAIVTGVYGSQRILNGKPKWPHYGIDFAAEEGTEIKAMLDGVVTLAEPDLFYTGGTLIFDHGHGVSTLYMHMKTLIVKKGQKVKQGDIIGTVGSTGRSTGAHLDVRLNWFQTRLDPATVLDIKN